MKTVLSRMKTLVNNNKGSGQTLSYVKHVEVLHPEIAQTVINASVLPSIFLVPVGSSEEWDATLRKKATHSVRAHLIMSYHQRELSIMGDASRPDAQGKGILDFVSDFSDVFRGHRLAIGGEEYLAEPLDIVDIEYLPGELSDNVFMVVATVTMKCVRLFMQQSLPGNV